MLEEQRPTYSPNHFPETQFVSRTDWDGGKFLTSVSTINRGSHGRVPACLHLFFVFWLGTQMYCTTRNKKTSSRRAVFLALVRKEI